MKILNAYAGIGGNRKNWDGEKHEIVAVENDPKKAEIYRDLFPHDEVLEADAYYFIEGRYNEFDFIWASPPCPSHSSIRKAGAKNGQYKAKMPDFKLYSIVEFLQEFFGGDYCVENVAKTWYDPWIKPQKESRHYFWSNFPIPSIDVPGQDIHRGNISQWENWMGVDLSSYNLSTEEKRKILRNCVHPKIGEKILKARKTRQVKLSE